MVKVFLRWCIAGVHSGFPFQYDVSETTTIGELCQMVIDTNNGWWAQNRSSQPFRIVKICGPNDTFWPDSHQIGGGYHQNECYLVFDAN